MINRTQFAGLWVKAFEFAWLVVLVGYVLLGTTVVPFHGDESTILWMSKDYDYIFIQDRLGWVRYSDPPQDLTEQHLRLLNGSLSRYIYGFSWSFNGYSVDQINEQWHWGFDWNWNVLNGHMPDDTLLMYGRWPSALMLAASVVVLYSIVRRIGGILGACIATLFYVLHPAILLQGRRAMFEGGTFLLTLLILWFGLRYLQSKGHVRWWNVLGFGFVTGLAISMKHTGIASALLVVGGFVVYEYYEYQSIYHVIKTNATKLLIMGLIALGVFYVLNPVWWHDPLTRAQQVISARNELLATQTTIFGGYSDFADKASGFFRQTFEMRPQYFEVEDWAEYIGDQITAYEATHWDGVAFFTGRVGKVVLFGFTLMGMVAMARLALTRNGPETLIIVWATLTLLINLLITPVEWQRYYLSGIPVVALLLGFLAKYMTSLIQRMVTLAPYNSSQNQQGIR